jgi:hypothetical protein
MLQAFVSILPHFGSHDLSGDLLHSRRFFLMRATGGLDDLCRSDS